MSTRILCFLAIFVFLSAVSAQEPPAKPQTPAEARAEQELNKRADALLTEVAQLTRELRSKENQITVRVGVADLLWKNHETAARALYKKAFADLRQAVAEVDDSDPEQSDTERSLSQLRDQLLQSLGRHDPIMARALLRETQPAALSDSSRVDQPTSEARSADARLELSLATEMANQNPGDAARIARETLKQGYSNELVRLLRRLAEKEPTTAQELTRELVAKLSKEDLSANYEAAGVASSLMYELFSSERTDPDKGESQKQTPLMDAQASRDFIEFVIAAALKKESTPGGTSLLMFLQSMMADIEQFAPAQASLLKQKLVEVDKTFREDDDSPYGRMRELSEKGDTKGMMDLAATAPPELRDSAYADIASRAFEQGDKGLANEALSKISSPRERRRLSSSFQERTVWQMIQDEEFAQARQYIAQAPTKERRMSQLIDLANAVLEKGDRKTALELVQEAHSFVASKARNEYELQAQIKIAGIFASLDPDRSFAILGSAIDQINELMAATAVVANFGPSRLSMQGEEFRLNSSFNIPHGFANLSARDVRTLSQVDFNKTKGLFDRFERPEARLAAYLLMSQSILAPPPAVDDCTCQQRLKRTKGEAAPKPGP